MDKNNFGLIEEEEEEEDSQVEKSSDEKSHDEELAMLMSLEMPQEKTDKKPSYSLKKLPLWGLDPDLKIHYHKKCHFEFPTQDEFEDLSPETKLEALGFARTR